MSDAQRPELRVTVFSDYICPFCYIGFVRLERLRTDYDLKVNWCMLEIHPDNPPEGRPVADLGYSDAQWADMMGHLGDMAREEGVIISPHTRTTNSQRALRLAEAAKEDGPAVFYALHRRLFEAYLGEGRNIGDPEVLRAIAEQTGVGPETLERAWSDPRYGARLEQNLAAARELEVTGTPTFFIGESKLVGAVPAANLLHAARLATAG
ncbi:MAG: DsbA family oxidoreductase [Gammaproteobacteria bacterium]|nr:DsbA family protein [Gammaproteobacteria bacterium]